MVRPRPFGDDQHPTTTSSRDRNNARARNTGNENSAASGSSSSAGGGSGSSAGDNSSADGSNNGVNGGYDGRGGRRRDNNRHRDASDAEESDTEQELADGDHQDPVQQDEAMDIDPVNPLENLWELDATVSDLPRTFSAARVNGVLPGRPSTFPNFGLATLNFLTFPRHLGFTSRILSWQLHGDLMPACLVRVTLLPIIFINNFHNKKEGDPIVSKSAVREAHSAAYFPITHLSDIFRFVSGTEGSVLCFLPNVARVILAELGDEAKATAIWLLLLHFAFAKLLTSRRQEGIFTSTLGFCAIINMAFFLIKEYEDHAGISLTYYKWFFHELGLNDLEVLTGDLPAEPLYPTMMDVMRYHCMEDTWTALQNSDRPLIDMFDGHRLGLNHSGKKTEECFKRSFQDYEHAANILDYLMNNADTVPDSNAETFKSFQTIKAHILTPLLADPHERDGMTILSAGVHPLEHGLEAGLSFNTSPVSETVADREIYIKAERKTYSAYESTRKLPNPRDVTVQHIAAELGLKKRSDPVAVRPPHLLSRYAPGIVETARDDNFLTDVDNVSPVRPSTPRTSPVSSIPRSEDDTEFDENAHENLANVRSERQELQNRVSELETQLREAQELARKLQRDLAEAQTRIGAAEGPSTSKRQKIVINDDLMPIKLEPSLMDEEVFSSSINKGSKPPAPKKSCRSQKRKISQKRKNNK